MSIENTLAVVIQKVAANKVNVNNALAQARATIVQADPEAVEAAKLLLKKFEHPQAVMQIVQNVAQIDALSDTSNEMDAMIAGLEVLLTQPNALLDAQKVLDTNASVTDSPLSESGGAGGTDQVADAGQVA